MRILSYVLFHRLSAVLNRSQIRRRSTVEIMLQTVIRFPTFCPHFSSCQCHVPNLRLLQAQIIPTLQPRLDNGLRMELIYTWRVICRWYCWERRKSECLTWSCSPRQPNNAFFSYPFQPEDHDVVCSPNNNECLADEWYAVDSIIINCFNALI